MPYLILIIIGQVEDQRFLAITIFVEKLVGIVKEDALGVDFPCCQQAGSSSFFAVQQNLLALFIG